MGRGGKKRFTRGKGGAPWNANGKKKDTTRNNNNQQAAAGNDGRHVDTHGGDHYVQHVAQNGNVRMEAYYAAQGLHNYSWKSKTATMTESESECLVPCENVREFNAERLAWRECMGRVLPASFRFTKEVTTSLKMKMERQLVELLQNALQEEKDEASKAKEEETVSTKKETTETTTVVKQEEVEIKEEEEDNAARRQRLQEPPIQLSVLLAQHQSANKQDDAEARLLLLQKLPFVEFAYQLGGLDRHAIRKHPRLKALHAWMKEQQDCGHLTRQETVSMIPPVVLNVQSHHQVLDMCAAPGSKTSQLLEKLGPHALLVANDANPDRAFMLTHQLKRLLHNTFPITLVTACQAQFFPSSTRGCNINNNAAVVVSAAKDETTDVKDYDDDTTTQPPSQLQKAESLQLFDRILADVPCTGDGTTRKNIHVWKQWTQQAALSLHPLQLDIAWKGASQLLKTPLDNNNNGDKNDGGGADTVEGGYLCYSTCSLNPIEDEAVVAELLRRAKGSLELVPITLSSSINSGNSDNNKNIAFRTRPGISHWKVFCEAASKREMKDLAKKNSQKMQQRRLELEKKDDDAGNNADEDTTANKDDKDKVAQVETNASKLEESDSKPSASNDVKDSDMKMDDKAVAEKPESKMDKAAPETEAATTTVKDNHHRHQIVKEATAAAAASPSIFEPTSMDQADLIAMAEAVGLKYMRTLADVPEHWSQRVRPSCFPPTPEEAEKFHLERCMRCLPQDNDTGGFFVALLRKVGPISKRDYRRQGEEEADTSGPDPKRVKLDVSAEQEEEKKKQGVAVKEDDDEDNEGQENIEMVDVEGLDADNMPVTSKTSGRKKVDDRFIPVGDEVLDPLIEYYGLAGPDFRKDLFMTRANGDSKVIYYLSVPVKNLLDRGIQDRVQVIASGLKAFSRNSTQHQCDVTHRIAQDAVYFVSQYMTKRKFVVDMHDFVHCMNVTSAKPMALTEGFSDKFAEAVRPIDVGAFVVDLIDGYENKGIDKKMAITMWRCRGDKISLLVTKIEVDSIRDKLQVIQEEQAEEEQTTKA